ncbi:DNA mismatch repair protein Msh2 [Hypsibius exemplaris]|uniref:DNA mismatch repair protein Msh2 n=1 Tax=Hypsibius exemplaris TaxID=2072580 RepID=A0A1W0XAP2_HYPEX|nr:DNA mismatch repair protein Msh2 [Hypsibius exemplaris]
MDSSMNGTAEASIVEASGLMNETEMGDAAAEMEVDETADAVPFFVLSEDVLQALDIKTATGKGSLYQLLNQCCTPQGSRLLLQWIARPLLDVAEIDKRLDLVEFFVKKPSVRRTVADSHLKKFPDFGPIVRKLEKRRIGLQDLYRIYQAIQKIPTLVKAILAETEDVAPRVVQLINERFITPLDRSCGDFTDYQLLIKETVEPTNRPGEFRINPALVPILQETDGQITELEAQMKEDWEKTYTEVNMTDKTLKLESDSRLGYLYRVTRKDEKLLRKTTLKLITVDTKTSGYRFRTEELDSLNEDYLRLTAKYTAAQEKVIVQLVETASTYAVPLKSFNKVLAPLDVIVGLASAAFNSTVPYVRPTILPQDNGIIELVECRHPYIETFMERNFIPNSVRFKQDEATFHIVTGPNMGGKSTYIRQVALNVVMAQIGSFVPCKSARVSLIDGVYTRIGAGDSVEKGVSTFMMEMLEIQEILKSATKYSLIIIDELGRGTSTYDGYGLAYAVSESIANDLGAYCMLTTHFNELAELKTSAKHVVLSHVAALVTEDGITFQYAVEPGVCSQSFGVNVAQMAGLPAHVIQDAKVILGELENAHKLGMAAGTVSPDAMVH